MKIRWLYLVWGGLLLACGGVSTTISTPDLVATEVAVKKAAAATLTAEVLPAETKGVEFTATETIVLALPSTTPSPTQQAAGDTIISATPINVPVAPPTLTPTPIPPTPVAVAPTPTPPLRVDVPVDGGQSDLKGQIVIPGFKPDELKGSEFGGVIFRDRLVFRVEVYNPVQGYHDGAGIDQVKISITNPDGELVHERTEKNAGYCVFGGGEPDCNVLVFAQSSYHWPEKDQSPIENGFHSVEIEIATHSGQTENWVWSFWIQR